MYVAGEKWTGEEIHGDTRHAEKNNLFKSKRLLDRQDLFRSKRDLFRSKRDLFRRRETNYDIPVGQAEKRRRFQLTFALTLQQTVAVAT